MEFRFMSDNNKTMHGDLPVKKRKINTWGIYISLIFIVVGIIWYGVNVGLIPVSLIQKQAGPIVVVVIGIMILIKSVIR
jgi:hypothetical protein